jgi:hypothetical protein
VKTPADQMASTTRARALSLSVVGVGGGGGRARSLSKARIGCHDEGVVTCVALTP